MNVIKDWLVSHNYAIGLELFKTIPGCDQAYLQFLTKDIENPTLEMRSLLERELLRVNDRLTFTNPESLAFELPKMEEVGAKQPIIMALPDAGQIVKVIRGTIKPEEMPVDIRTIYDLNGVIATNIKELKKKVHDSETPEEDAKIALNLLIEAEDKYNENWDKIDEWYFAANQNNPELEKQQVAIKAIKLHKEKNNLENYIRKFAKEPAKVEEYRGKLEIVIKALDEITGGVNP
jgi:hypothetical protein